jgi:5'-3' exonuclease
MGIPSYFKHILDRYKYLLKPVGTDTRASVLLVDFNCLIYACVRAPTMPMYSFDSRMEWEALLLKHICDYVLDIWASAGKPVEVYLAVDGVVPMAKIRQQRIRRFKSVWMTGQERALGIKKDTEDVWDTNSITPGTAFMEKLSVELTKLCTRRGWILSGAEEAGEGEQKLMTWIRGRPAGWFQDKNIFVYGLDADLIVLSMFHAGTGLSAEAQWTILREKQEFGKFGASATASKFLTLNVSKLVEILFPNVATRDKYLYDYVAGMCLLGNDFVPHSLGIHIREHGHDRLEQALNDLHTENLTLLIQENGIYIWNKVALERILSGWTKTESDDIVASFKQKYKMRGPTPKNDNEWKLLPIQNLPIEWADEDRLWNKEVLLDGWKMQYYNETSSLVSEADVTVRCREYCMGLQWIIDYYTGQRAPSLLSQEWMYAWTYPPLWSDLLEYVKDQSNLPSPPVQLGNPLQPQEQLSLVLPLESWGLIRNSDLKTLPEKVPAFWPRTFGFISLGKRWMWECPPRIPIMNIARLRSIIRVK